MHLTVIGTFGFDDPDPGLTLKTWVQLTGVDAVQGYRNPSANVTEQAMLDAASAAGLSYDSIHGLFGLDLDPSSPSESVRQSTIATYRSEGEFVRRLGGTMVVVHPSPQMNGSDRADPDVRRRQLARSISELSELGSELGVDYLIENQPPGHPIGASVSELVSVLRQSRTRHIGLCFDTGHAHIAGDEVGALKSVGSLLRMVHASDNHGGQDEHLFCLDGTVDWAGLGLQLKRMQFAGPFMFEVFFDAAGVHRVATADRMARLRRDLCLDPL